MCATHINCEFVESMTAGEVFYSYDLVKVEEGRYGSLVQMQMVAAVLGLVIPRYLLRSVVSCGRFYAHPVSTSG